MQRRSERIKQSGTSMRTKQRANRKTPVQIDSSQSDSDNGDHTEEVPINVVFPEEAQEVREGEAEPSTGLEKDDQTLEKESVEKSAPEKDPTDLQEEPALEKTMDSDKQQEEPKEKDVSEKSTKTVKRKSASDSKKDSKRPKVSEPEDVNLSKKKKKVSGKVSDKSKGNSSGISGSWFLNILIKAEWEKGYKDRTLAYCSFIEQELLQDLNTRALKNLRSSQFRKILNIGYIAYPRLTRLFYLNMTSEVVDGELVIRTLVAGVYMEITQDIVAKALNMKVSKKKLPDKKVCIEEGKKEFLLPGGEAVKQLTQSRLNCEARILFTILIRCIVPKASSKELVTDKMIELMYLISEGYKVNVPSIIMDHMISCSAKGRNHSLPYGNILLPVFENFKVPVENEESFNSFETLDEKTFGKMGMCLTKEGEWKFFADLTAKERKDKDFVKPRTTVPSSSVSANVDNKELLEKIDLLGKKVDGLSSEVKSMDEEFVGFKLQLDEIHKLLKASQEKKEVEEEVDAESEEETGSDEESDEETDEDLADKGKKVATGKVSDDKGKKIASEDDEDDRMEDFGSEDEDDGNTF